MLDPHASTGHLPKHTPVIIEHWTNFRTKVEDLGTENAVDGHGLDIATVVAVARYGAQIYLDSRTLDSVRQSADTLHSSLREGQVIYGVNTGFGGSADTRTRQVEELQRTLIREMHSGILVPSTKAAAVKPTGLQNHKWQREGVIDVRDNDRNERVRPPPNGETPAAPVDDSGCFSASFLEALRNAQPADHESTSMPESWIKASILIRINSIASAYSGVRPTLITTMVDLLKHDILPRIPLRGSISASGDLSPLSYIAGTLSGKRTLTVSIPSDRGERRRFVTADVALAHASIAPIRLGPKEGLAVVNGTAVSTAVGALAMHDAHCLAVLAQVLTAMSVEALCGTSESFDPFFAQVRPHPGQQEAGHNIFHFLSGSSLVQNPDGSEEGSLRQDRYSIRTASQWVGPVLEDLLLAHRQIAVECNSVTDNPLIDGKRMLHGGNFQARSITSAMEKVRLAVQTIGRMLFTQCTELINPRTNRGLPPNLVAEEPNSSWVFKPVDIMIAALQSELGFLANPVGTHVQTAEMGNQSLNSLALISARYCHTALDVLSQLAASHLFAICQAFDLRAMHISFLERYKPRFEEITAHILTALLKAHVLFETLLPLLWTKLRKALDEATTMNSDQRFDSVVSSLQPILLKYISSTEETIPVIETWAMRCSESMLEAFEMSREAYSAHPDATSLLGKAGKRVYTFVRHTLAIPFLRSHHIKSPNPEIDLPDAEDHLSELDGNTTKDHVTTGSFITTIYSAIRSGTLYVPVMECLQEAQQAEVATKPANDDSTRALRTDKFVDSLVSEAKLSLP